MSLMEAEVRRVSRRVGLMARSGDYVAEAPARIHGRAVDSGNDYLGPGAPLRLHPPNRENGLQPRSDLAGQHDTLGAPVFDPRFEAWLKAGGVCMCEPHVEDGEIIHRGCNQDERANRLRRSANHNDPRRMKRALRKLRAVSPASFPLVWLLLVRGNTYAQATAAINTERHARGLEPHTETDFAVLVIAGFDLCAALF